MRSQAVGVVLLLLIAGAARALNTASVQAKLDAKKQQILKIKGTLVTMYAQMTGQTREKISKDLDRDNCEEPVRVRVRLGFGFFYKREGL